ncbi:barstar family protein [Clostridium sp. D33t1_170424_F3]|uniref:barstar family protein n=1 Tax=Clostridium sp. D33t1_170424_F3 TaxID=2787099 RepID=UPI003369CD41
MNDGREKIITLDLTDCKYLGEIHQRIKKAFDFPDFYGENWSAFMDLLWTECDANRIIVLGEHTVPKELEPSVKMINEILQELKDFRAEFNDFIEIEIYS